MMESEASKVSEEIEDILKNVTTNSSATQSEKNSVKVEN